MYASLLGISGALHLAIFGQPAKGWVKSRRKECQEIPFTASAACARFAARSRWRWKTASASSSRATARSPPSAARSARAAGPGSPSSGTTKGRSFPWSARGSGERADGSGSPGTRRSRTLRKRLSAIRSAHGGRSILWSDAGGPFSDLRRGFCAGPGFAQLFRRGLGPRDQPAARRAFPFRH